MNGFSNGGGMTYLAACKLQERIAAVGMISGAYLTEKENCLTIRPVPTILFHGKLDQIVPYKVAGQNHLIIHFPISSNGWLNLRLLMAARLRKQRTQTLEK